MLILLALLLLRRCSQRSTEPLPEELGPSAPPEITEPGGPIAERPAARTTDTGERKPAARTTDTGERKPAARPSDTGGRRAVRTVRKRKAREGVARDASAIAPIPSRAARRREPAELSEAGPEGALEATASAGAVSEAPLEEAGPEEAVPEEETFTLETFPQAEGVQPECETALLLLVVNGAEHGEVSVVLTNGNVLVARSDIEDAGVRVDDLPTEDVEGAPHIDVAALPGQMAYTLDEDTLRLEITVPIDRLGTSVLDLARTPPDMLRPTDASAFLNYAVRVLDLERTDTYGEAGVSVGDTRFYTGLSYTVGEEPVRGLTNVTVDLRTRMLRFVAGDAYSTGTTLGGSAYVGGLHLTRSHVFDPYFVPGPTLDRSAEVLVPSTLEVYVNDQLTHREQVNPGTFDIQNIPATAGAGDTRIVLRDALGHEHTLSASYYRPTGLLSLGDQEYSYALGFEREQVATESFGYGGPVLAGRHRFGVAPQLTLGGQAVAMLDRVEGSALAVAGLGFGQVEVAGGGSASADGPGAASSLAYAFRSRRFGMSVWGRYTSDTFTSLSLDAADDRATLESGVSLGLPIGSGVSANGSYARTQMRDSGLGQRATLSTSASLPWNLHLGLLGGWSEQAEAPTEWYAWASLMARFGRLTSATVRAETGSGATDAYAELQRSLPPGNGLGFRVGGRADGIHQGWAYGDGRAPFGLAHAGVDWASGGDPSTELGVSGGIVALGGRVKPTQPVQQGYALVRVPGVPGVGVTRENNPVGRTDRRGDAVVQKLLPYYGNRLGIEDADVPVDYTVGSVERLVAPAERSGAVVVFPVARARIVRGTVRVEGADPAFGELTIVAGDVEYGSLIGRQGEFEFESLPAGRWAGTAAFGGRACTLVLEVPDADGAVLQLGDVACVEPPRMSVR